MAYQVSIMPGIDEKAGREERKLEKFARRGTTDPEEIRKKKKEIWKKRSNLALRIIGWIIFFVVGFIVGHLHNLPP